MSPAFSRDLLSVKKSYAHSAFYILTLGNSGFAVIIHTDTHLIHIGPQSDIKTLWDTFTAEERDLKRSGFVGNSNAAGKVEVATTSVTTDAVDVRAEAGSAFKLPLGLVVTILLMYHT